MINIAKNKWTKWTDELVNQFKTDYPNMSWDELIIKYPFTKSSLMTKASELGIRRNIGRPPRFTEEDIQTIKDCVRQNVSDIEIAELIHRTPASIKTKRERLGLVSRDIWSGEEDDVLYKYYSNMPASEVASMLNNRNRNSVVCRAMKLGINGYKPYKDYSHKDNTFIQENYLFMTDAEIGQTLNRSEASIKNHRNAMGLHRPKNKTQYEDITSYFRKYNSQWKTDSMKLCNYKCVVSGGRFDDIHHLTALNTIVQNAMSNISIDIENFDINNTDDRTKKIIVNAILEEQFKYGYGVCLSKHIHTQFHNLYGYGENTPEQFYEFVKIFYPTHELKYAS